MIGNTGPNLTRRGMFLGAAALSLAGCSQPWTSHADVVIVGAGAAGIAAAQMLATLGRSAIVIEAADRIGGRAFTDSGPFGIPFDIGCAWIHAAKTNPFFQFAIERGFHLRYHSLELNEIYYGAQKQHRDFVASEHQAEETIGGTVEDAAKAGKDVSIASLMTSWVRPNDAAATNMGPMDAAVDFPHESVFDFSAEAEAEYDPNYLVKEGFGALVAQVGRGLNVWLSTRAQAIRRNRGGVEVDTPRGTISARAAIVTPSMGVLAKERIAFTPQLPQATRDAIHALPMGLLTKIPMLISGTDTYGIQPYDNVLNEDGGKPDDVYFLAWPWDSRLMVGFVGGDFAWRLSRARDPEVIDFVKEKLAQVCGSAIKAKAGPALVTPWANNPLTLGAYSAEAPGHHDARAALRVPVDERVFFAGEAVAENGLFATCGGAYLSGQSVARDVHAALM
ncbi:MAG: flavin monoamine oxidase family protein [Rhizomicrobium sp.]